MRQQELVKKKKKTKGKNNKVRQQLSGTLSATEKAENGGIHNKI